ncbi:hypothetical protein J8273_1107 [Carpediemonas membranifera]|uniref:Uncharacterized protein n=1 Tax=Carpediemonas membranifera TaxID=201153 RepID=A0A8J6AYI5_9EUKA|nr:hypothetical protein J8273_1107 [Carpediemonas membranifera]|eukprot:KAG9397198.1 hypothetical protein J8273_1107 [Carpediemonas membranifera]
MKEALRCVSRSFFEDYRHTGSICILAVHPKGRDLVAMARDTQLALLDYSNGDENPSVATYDVRELIVETKDSMAPGLIGTDHGIGERVLAVTSLAFTVLPDGEVLLLVGTGFSPVLTFAITPTHGLEYAGSLIHPKTTPEGAVIENAKGDKDAKFTVGAANVIAPCPKSGYEHIVAVLTTLIDLVLWNLDTMEPLATIDTTNTVNGCYWVSHREPLWAHWLVDDPAAPLLAWVGNDTGLTVAGPFQTFNLDLLLSRGARGHIPVTLEPDLEFAGRMEEEPEWKGDGDDTNQSAPEAGELHGYEDFDFFHFIDDRTALYRSAAAGLWVVSFPFKDDGGDGEDPKPEHIAMLEPAGYPPMVPKQADKEITAQVEKDVAEWRARSFDDSGRVKQGVEFDCVKFEELDKLVWSNQISPLQCFTPVVEGDRLYIGNSVGQILVYDLSQRSEWRAESPAFVRPVTVFTLPESKLVRHVSRLPCGDLLVCTDDSMIWRLRE